MSQKSEVRRVVVQNKTNVDIETLKLQEISAQEQNPDEEPLPSDSNQNNATVTVSTKYSQQQNYIDIIVHLTTHS